MSIYAASKSAFGIQADRALAYGLILFMTLVAAFILAIAIGPQAGWLLFAVWTLLCAFAARQGHLLAWTVLCLTPLALICLLWLASLGGEDSFGLRWVYILNFTGASLVTAATGILTLLPRGTPSRAKPISAQGSTQA